VSQVIDTQTSISQTT